MDDCSSSFLELTWLKFPMSITRHLITKAICWCITEGTNTDKMMWICGIQIYTHLRSYRILEDCEICEPRRIYTTRMYLINCGWLPSSIVIEFIVWLGRLIWFLFAQDTHFDCGFLIIFLMQIRHPEIQYLRPIYFRPQSPCIVCN